DGDGIYRVRFMPSFEGAYSFTVKGSFSDEVYEGVFTAIAPSEGNHGPVRVSQTYHFAYEDGTPYYSIGTTCYVWNHQKDELIAKTLETLKNSAFNKIRFCVFPKHYDYNLREPRSYPYVGTPMDSSVLTKENFSQYTGKAPGNDFDYMRFNPAHFQHLDKCVEALMDLGIQADLIVMHPYDRWGFSEMSAECDDLYWKYVIARLSANRNIWWSLANEYDLFPKKTLADWERYASIICEKDAYGHLRSIHNCFAFYDHSRPWITHCSIQRQDLYKSAELVNEWRARYKKPVVLDEIAYEGNIQHGWGNISGQEMTRRFWEAFCRGGYPGHGETFLNENDILWWSHGGELHGESPERFRFLQKIMEETPAPGLRPWEKCSWDEVAACEDVPSWIAPTSYYIFYYSFMRPGFRSFYFDDNTLYKAEVIDTWNMTIEDMGTFKGHFNIPLPGREYMAIRIRRM
ncbi:MAG: DUF5605 domain-containing protein, partial [Clostridiales bacterium]|nr:DUF5605 domain-containing protein [Candidatus Blautia equi]